MPLEFYLMSKHRSTLSAQGEETSVTSVVYGEDEQHNGEYSDKGEFRRMSDVNGRATDEQPRSSWIVNFFNNSIFFWLSTFFAPGIQVCPSCHPISVPNS